MLLALGTRVVLNESPDIDSTHWGKFGKIVHRTTQLFHDFYTVRLMNTEPGKFPEVIAKDSDFTVL